MNRFNIAVRWPNGDVEGISGYGFDLEAAERKAYLEANSKARFLKQDYELICRSEGCTVEESLRIKEDWNSYN